MDEGRYRVLEGVQEQLGPLLQELSLPPVKIHCSILAEDAIKAAVADYKKKHNVQDKEAA